MKMISISSLNLCFIGCLLLLLFGPSHGFGPQINVPSRTIVISTTQVNVASARSFDKNKKNNKQTKEPNHFLLEEFATHDGEVLNPYNILKVPREADRTEIRRSYIELSKRYHPDKVRHRDILPGRCNNLDDVRDEWERIKLSYEILRDSKTRRRFDRHDVIADPGAAMRRAAFTSASKGVANVGKGLFNLGSFAIEQLTNKDDKKEEEK